MIYPGAYALLKSADAITRRYLNVVSVVSCL